MPHPGFEKVPMRNRDFLKIGLTEKTQPLFQEDSLSF
jgi:hypothetical protein